MELAIQSIVVGIVKRTDFVNCLHIAFVTIKRVDISYIEFKAIVEGDSFYL